MDKNYYVRFDIGTNSVGYAVTDEDYNLFRIKGKNAWGVRLLDEAQTAAERRIIRSNRRRMERRKYRIKLLRELFGEEINKIDPSFFIRLDESFFNVEDKKVEGKYSLFFDEEFNDKNYYKKYPTIYHLRQELINNPEKHDIRLIYLAISHILKHRGHFLKDGEMGNSDDSLPSIFNKINAFIYDNFSDNPEIIKFDLNDSNVEDIQKVISNNNLSPTKKKDEILEKLQNKSKFADYVVKAMLG